MTGLTPASSEALASPLSGVAGTTRAGPLSMCRCDSPTAVMRSATSRSCVTRPARRVGQRRIADLHSSTAKQGRVDIH